MIGQRLTGDVASTVGSRGVVTLVEGRTFCLSSSSGDITPESVEGLFVLDVRAVSRWQLRVNGAPVEGLAVDVTAPYGADFAGRSRPLAGHADSPLVVLRHRRVGHGMYERIEVVNHDASPANVTVELVCDCDFADIFDVKAGRSDGVVTRIAERVGDRALRFCRAPGDVANEVTITTSEPAIIEAGMLTWRRSLAPHERWEVCCEVTLTFEGHRMEPRFRCGHPEEETVPSQRMASWRGSFPAVRSSWPELDRAVARSAEDLGSLRIFDAEHPDVPILAAGAPWYMTLFGRDSLLTAWMTLLADPSLARGVLETLARLQGDDVVARTDEEPGKILHEVRLDLADGMSLAAGDVYYGSVDATPLFVMLLGEAWRWGLDDATVQRLLPHADRALDWIERFGDRDGDGYVEYQRATPDGLANQGWKDSWDSIRYADGRFAQPPLALCEVQAYVYGAYLARAELACAFGDGPTERRCRERAAELRRRFHEDFWLEDRGWFALALDGDKRPVDALASNVGHCLWAEIVEPELVERVAAQLLSPEMFSGWGVRTLATSMAAYNPVSYHNGSVWPHDNAITIAGLARYGCHEHAHRIVRAQVDVTAHHDGRLPELFAGFGRAEFGVPAAYPSSCSPQAWAAASPLLWLRALLGLDPHLPEGRIWVAPVLPDELESLEVSGVRLGERTLTISVDRAALTVDGAAGLVVHRAARPVPLTSGPPSA